MDQGLGMKVQPGTSLRPESGAGRNSRRILSHRRGRGLHRPICQGTGAPRDHGAADRRESVPICRWLHDHALGISIGFFYVYQIIDAIRTAKAIQDGRACSRSVRSGANLWHRRKVRSHQGSHSAPPSSSAWVCCSCCTPPVFDFSLHRFWPLILIVLGVWLFAKHWGLLGTYRPACVCERCRTRKLMGPAILVTLGVLFLLDNVSRVDIWQDLARHPAGDWRGQADAEQRFVRRTLRPAASGHVRPVFHQCSAECLAAGSAECSRRVAPPRSARQRRIPSRQLLPAQILPVTSEPEVHNVWQSNVQITPNPARRHRFSPLAAFAAPRRRSLAGPFVLIVIGTVFLLATMHVLSRRAPGAPVRQLLAGAADRLGRDQTGRAPARPARRHSRARHRRGRSIPGRS